MSSSRADELSGKVAIVTGGSRGIGHAIAGAFCTAGARVLITGRNPDAGEKAAAALGTAARFIAADQGDDGGWQRTIATALSEFGRVDIFVSNAGISEPAPTPQMSLEKFRETNRISLKGAFLGLQHCVRAMRLHGEGGSVILISSIVGKVGVPGLIHYSAAKGGLRLMAKAAALELGPEKIRVNSIHPGMIRTDMTRGFDEAQMAALIPLGRFGEPREVADVALFLASLRGQFVTGAELIVDGGWVSQ